MKKLVGLKQRQDAWKQAMPEVEKLARKYDRAVVAHCLNQLANKAKLAKKIAALKEEAESLERKL